jgi:hypothetical protein
MKIALCFIINYKHILHKEKIWREWIQPNKDIINIYFYYKDLNKIQSSWIRRHAIPEENIYNTSYFYVIPAYLSLLQYSITHDQYNQWFCFLTDSCCPIISPEKFRYLFYCHFNKSILKWQPAWWNIQVHKRANLALLPQTMRLANDPWFVLEREDAIGLLETYKKQQNITSTVCKGGLANESLFAILFYCMKQLTNVISQSTHITDWSRMTSSTSPYVFKHCNEVDLKFIDGELKKNNYAMFLRKVDEEFPNEILEQYIYKKQTLNYKQTCLLLFFSFYFKCKYFIYSIINNIINRINRIKKFMI